MHIAKIPDDRQQFLALREELRQLARRLFPGKDAAELQHEVWGGSLKPFDAHYLAEVLRRYRPATLLEVGSYLGMSTRWILHVSEPWKCRLTCVDPNIAHWSFRDPRKCAPASSS